MPAYKGQAGQQCPSTLGMAALVLALHLQAQSRKIDDHGNNDEADDIGIVEQFKHVPFLSSNHSLVKDSTFNENAPDASMMDGRGVGISNQLKRFDFLISGNSR